MTNKAYLLRSPEDWVEAKRRVDNGDGCMGEYAYLHNDEPHCYPVLAWFSCWDHPDRAGCDWTFMDRAKLIGLLMLLESEEQEIEVVLEGDHEIDIDFD